MKTSNLKKTLFDFFEGKHTTFEAKMIEEWLELDENKEIYFDYLNQWERANPQLAIDENSRLEIIMKAIESKTEEVSENFNVPDTWSGTIWPSLKVAAAIALFFLGLGYAVVRLNNGNLSSVTYQQNVDEARKSSGEIFEKQNLGDSPLLVNLPDGSSVLLQASAKISYNPKMFGVDRREVIMEGEAFFEVYKDKDRPFVVYANDLIAKVLGTSFTVKARPGSHKAEVLVKSGKVSVFSQQDKNKVSKITGSDLKGVVLKPAEKIEISGDKNLTYPPMKIEKSDISEEIERLSFNFDEVYAGEVFQTLEKAYNVDVIYDKESFASSRLTAHLGDEPLKEKLKLICLALETTYQEIDGKIIILPNK